MKKNSEPGSGMNIPDLIFEILVSVFWFKILLLFDADQVGDLVNPGYGIQDGKKIVSGINIRDQQL